MLISREDFEASEKRNLAPYAQLASQSLGRAVDEPFHPYRTAYQRDRARIIHSKAFRRLEWKTQVFRSGSGDHLRNRLTHTIEVCNAGRGIARSLALNEDLAEAIALAHDLGHPPFGHSGEKTLNRLMKEHGGFNHNEQSLRIVESIEKPYPAFDGLNLSYEVLEGLRKHDSVHQLPQGAVRHRPSLEAQVADIADEIAYYSHDLDDGLRHGLLDERELESVAIWRRTREFVGQRFPGISGRPLRAAIIRFLIDSLVEDVIMTTHEALLEADVASVEEVRSQESALVRYSEATSAMNRELRAFLYERMYHSCEVDELNRAGCRMLEDVFLAYVEDPGRIPKGKGASIPREAPHRAVCDYVSGMTDTFLPGQHAILFGGAATPDDRGCTR